MTLPSGASTMVNGTPDSQLASNAALKNPEKPDGMTDRPLQYELDRFTVDASQRLLFAGLDNGYLGEAIAADLIRLLSGRSRIRVASHTSSFVFRSPPADARTVAKTLNVAKVLAGQITNDGDRLVVGRRTATLSTQIACRRPCEAVCISTHANTAQHRALRFHCKIRDAVAADHAFAGSGALAINLVQGTGEMLVS